MAQPLPRQSAETVANIFMGKLMSLWALHKEDRDKFTQNVVIKLLSPQKTPGSFLIEVDGDLFWHEKQLTK